MEELRIIGCTARVESKPSRACRNKAPRQRVSLLVVSGTQESLVGKPRDGADLVFTPAQSFTNIASKKVDQAKDAASKTKDKTTGTSKSVYDSVAANLQSARDASAKQLEDNRAAADQQWAKLQKVLLLHHPKHSLVQRQCS